MREIKFRGKSLRTGEWIYGNLIVHKEECTRLTYLEGNHPFTIKTLIQYKNKNGNYSSCEVDERTVGQFIGTGEYGEIYEGMELYDEYAEENCEVKYDEEECCFVLCYDNVIERIQDLDGLQPLEKCEPIKKEKYNKKEYQHKYYVEVTKLKRKMKGADNIE